MARAVLFRGDLYREWLAYGSDAKRVAEAFVAGINAYVALAEARPELLPPEFRVLGYKPARWRAEDIVRIRHHGLTTNFTGELDRAQLYCHARAGAARADWLRRELDPQVEPRVPEGLDPCSVPVAELRRAYDLATAPPRFPRNGGATPPPRCRPRRSTPPSTWRATWAAACSNNWVIAGSRTATGRPILANDPHRAHGAPSLRYISHLNAPGLSVIGAGEPFLPGISIGHNEHIAFGLTRFYIDREDVYGYETNPANPHEYRYKGRWEPMESVTEEIAVRGEAVPRKVAIDFTRHGPVLFADAKGGRAWRCARPARPRHGALLRLDGLYAGAELGPVPRRHEPLGAPGENCVYADRAGNIGWLPAGLTPVRPNWDGLMPVPGDGRYEWAGYRDMDQLPWAFNPAAGYVVTANENTIPPNHPAARPGVGYEWSDTARARRLKSPVAASPHATLEDSIARQNDTVSLPAQRPVALLKDLQSTDPQLRRGSDPLRGWDGNERADSAPAALFEVWFGKYLRPAVVRAALPAEVARLVGSGDAARVLAVLERPEPWMPLERRNDAMLGALKQAMGEMERKLGADPAGWQWGKLHAAVFRHPLDTVLDAAARQKFDVNAGPIGGSSFTPMNASYRAGDYQLSAGAVLPHGAGRGQLGCRAGGQCARPVGQSGQPAPSRPASLWVRGETFPLVYSRRAVEKESRERLELVPPAP